MKITGLQKICTLASSHVSVLRICTIIICRNNMYDSTSFKFIVICNSHTKKKENIRKTK